MSDNDRIFGLYRSADPAAELARTVGEPPPLRELLAVTDRGLAVDPESEHEVVVIELPTGTAPDSTGGRGDEPGAWWRRRSIALVAAAAVAALAGLAVAGLRRPVPTEPVQSVDRVELLEGRALDAVADWFDAVNRGDAERVLELSSEAASAPADAEVYRWLAGLATSGWPMQVPSPCLVTVLSVGDGADSDDIGTARVECPVVLTLPVAQALGQDQLIAPFRYEDGRVAWETFRGGDIGAVNSAIGDHLQLYHPEDYRQGCRPDPAAQGSVIASGGIELTGECADLVGRVAEEIGRWVEDGRPTP